jgi:hypothetical protein
MEKENVPSCYTILNLSVILQCTSFSKDLQEIGNMAYYPTLVKKSVPHVVQDKRENVILEESDSLYRIICPFCQKEEPIIIRHLTTEGL